MTFRFAQFSFDAITKRLKPIPAAAREFGRELLNLILPPRCMRCEAELPAGSEVGFCRKCLQIVAPELGCCCGRCGSVLPGEAAAERECPACKDFSLKFDAVFPLGRYDGALRNLVLKTKRLSSEAFSRVLGRLLAQRLGDKIASFRPDVIQPIPMHWVKRIIRGVNGAELLADGLGITLGVPVVRSVVRSRYTGPQKELLPRERFRNVRGAFRLRRARHEQWRNSRWLLVDDILTTGATCSEVARLLKEAGAAAVAVAVVARADGS